MIAPSGIFFLSWIHFSIFNPFSVGRAYPIMGLLIVVRDTLFDWFHHSILSQILIHTCPNPAHSIKLFAARLHVHGYHAFLRVQFTNAAHQGVFFALIFQNPVSWKYLSASPEYSLVPICESAICVNRSSHGVDSSPSGIPSELSSNFTPHFSQILYLSHFPYCFRTITISWISSMRELVLSSPSRNPPFLRYRETTRSFSASSRLIVSSFL